MKELEEAATVLRASRTTNVGKLAGAIVASFEKGKYPEILVRSIGAGAVNQAVKSTIIANRQFVKKGYIAMILPSFSDFDNGKTAVVFSIKVRKL